ncbi:MAG: Na+/H+ antiporter [Dysgonamonadaceae bacterium]
MHERIFLVVGLLLVVCLLVMVAEKIRVAFPIFLVLAGLGISLIPGFSTITLDPDIIFLIFLPPILYEAAWYTSWNEFWKWKRPIGLLAFGLVFLTSLIVAYASSALIPGFTLALGFVLGGIISPPDAIAATTVLKGMEVPKRTLTILEGESLVNDASSLIVFRFALLAVVSGSFHLHEAVGEFFIVAGMGIVVGLIGAHIMYAIHRFLPTTPEIDATLTIVTPYLLYLGAEHFHFSGVMAVVSAGLFMSFRSQDIFQTGRTRVNMVGFWNTLIFIMNALVFILIGLELPVIVGGLGQTSLLQGIKYGLIISAIAIVVRLVWIYPVAHIPRFLNKKEAGTVASPGWKNPLIIGWAGMRGVVSLATALSIPLFIQPGIPFPMRNLILLITFVVIFVTLIFQGLTLPFLIKMIGLKEMDAIKPSYQQQAEIMIRLNEIALKLIEEKYRNQEQQNVLIEALILNLEKENEMHSGNINSYEVCSNRRQDVKELQKFVLEIHSLQRKQLFRMKKNKEFSDEEIRKAEMQLDFEELKILGGKHL